MPKFNKPLPEMLNAVWASEALSQNNVYPDINYVEEGWLQIKPPYEYENAINYKHDQFIAHINQLGVVEWDEKTEYQANKSYVQSGNLIYKCIQTHTNRSPSTAGNGAFWELFEGNRQSTESSRGTLRIATQNQVNSGNNESSAITPAKLKSFNRTIWANHDLSTDGYQIFPTDGAWSYVRLWGEVETQGNSVTIVTLPISVGNANNVLNIQVTDFGVPNASLGATRDTASRIQIENQGITTRVFWSVDARIPNN